MFKKHRKIIDDNLQCLIDDTDLNRLMPIIISKKIFSDEDLKCILDPSDITIQKRNLYKDIQDKGGPNSFFDLHEALLESQHVNLANLLIDMDSREQSQVVRRPSLNSVGSGGSLNSTDLKIENLNSQNESAQRPVSLNMEPENEIVARPHTPPNKSPTCEDKLDSSPTRPSQSSGSGHTHPYKLPHYLDPISDELKNCKLEPDSKINLNTEWIPVKVKRSNEWMKGKKTENYKMDRKPRGYALVVNNIDFSGPLTTRNGAECDEKSIKELLEQLYFIVELHRNKTMREMESIVSRFSQKPELDDADCLIVVFMSHGEDGATNADTMVLGINGVGLRIETILSYFYSDNCPRMVDKPKLFFFQCCRGQLPDPGIMIDPRRRIETDGKKVRSSTIEERIPYRVRTMSDIYIAYGVAPGRESNRDRLTGTWFIQGIVRVFSEHAHDMSLDDMIKLVDVEIKRMNNMLESNFQTVHVNHFGWSKQLFFNPGLHKTASGKTVRSELYSENGSTSSSNGRDVVDTASESTNDAQCKKKSKYFRLKDNHRHDDDDDDQGCYPVDRCKTC